MSLFLFDCDSHRCVRTANDISSFSVIFGEFANFAAYAYAPAILVTPLGALSVIFRFSMFFYVAFFVILCCGYLFEIFLLR